MRIDELAQTIEELGGVATAAQLKQAGFSPGLIDYALKQGTIDKLTRGVYYSVDMFEDDYAAISARWTKCIFSHATALSLWDLSDRIPMCLTVTVPQGYNPKSLATEYPNIRINRVAADIYELGLTKIKTPLGSTVPVYNRERSIADLLVSRNKGRVDSQLVHDAINGYFKSSARDINYLSNMCEALGVRDALQIYLEVLA